MSKDRKLNKGFTLLEALFSLSVSSIVLLSALPLLQNIRNLSYDTDRMQDRNGINQLVLYMSLAEEKEIGNDFISYRYQEEYFTLSLVNSNLILQPGTDIMIANLDTVYFYEENEKLYMAYQRGTKQYRDVIGYE